MLLLLAALQATTAPLQVVRLERVTASPGARDGAAAIAGPKGVVVLWEQARGIDREAQPRPPVRIWRARLGPTGASGARVLVATEGNQWWPAPLAAGNPLLAVYSADRTRRTGDRDILLYRPDPDWLTTRRVAPLTHDQAGGPFPINDATPALARTADGRILLAWSSGAYRAGERYRDKDIRLALVRDDGVVTAWRAATDSTELGHEYAPAILAEADGHLHLAYASDSAAGGRYDLYLRRVTANLRAGPPMRLTWSAGGATRPSLARLGQEVWVGWLDLATSDVRLARLEDGRLQEELGLRDLLQQSGFPRAGAPQAPLAGASLFSDGDRLGVAFVATLSLEPRRQQIQQDVFVAWLSP